MTRPSLRDFYLSLLVLIVACLQPVGVAHAAEAVGYVESKRGVSGTEVWIVRSGRKVSPRAGTPIYAGDQIRVTGEKARLVLRLEGARGTKIVRKSNQPYRVPKPRARSWGKWASDTFESIGWALGITDRKEIRSTGSRSEFEAIYPLEPLALLDSPKLFVAEGMSPVSMRWCGDAGALKWTIGKTLVASGSPIRTFGSAVFLHLQLDASGTPVPQADRLVIGPATPTGDEVFQPGPALDYHIEWLKWDDIPRPDHLPFQAQLTAEQKAEWAMWLIDQSGALGGKQHNLIAINLLEAARSDFWPAGYLLDQMTVCEGLASQIE